MLLNVYGLACEVAKEGLSNKVDLNCPERQSQMDNITLGF